MISQRKFSGIAALFVVLFSAISTFGQENARPTIETGGKASVAVSPEFVRFELTRAESGPNTIDSVKQALAFEERVRAGFEDMDLSPLTIETRELQFERAGRTSITLDCRFSIGADEDISERSVRVAEMLDKVSTVGESLKAPVLGPYFEVQEREAVEQDAVARATENALYQADAIASLVGENIFSVKSVRVVSVVWGQDSNTGEPQPSTNILGVRCSAKVRVTYYYGTR